MRARRWIRLAQYGLIIIGVAALGYCVSVWVGAERFQAREARKFNRELHRTHIDVTPRHVPLAPLVPEDGGLLGKIEIPRIGVSVMVVEGIGAGDLRRGVGHVPGTALPWQGGNVAIAGHRDTYFRPLRSIHRNDRITLRTLEGAFHYRVVSTQVVGPKDVEVLSPTRRDVLTLVTCFPFYYVGAAPKRFIVRAERLPG